MIPKLAERYRVIVPDLRGLGLTEKPNTGYDKRTVALFTRGRQSGVKPHRDPVECENLVTPPDVIVSHTTETIATLNTSLAPRRRDTDKARVRPGLVVPNKDPAEG